MGVEIMGNRASHVGMMIDGERFIHAANEDLGVRTDALASDWYRPKFIGARRIFETAGAEPDHHKPSKDRGALPPMPAGRVKTPNPWNSQEFGTTWDGVYQWADVLQEAARAEDVDVCELAVVMMVETQGIHERDGQVIEVGDNSPQDGPSVGLMQVKPQVWGGLRPYLDPWQAADNIWLGAAVLRQVIREHGDFFTAIAKGYHPGTAPNGTTGNSYAEAARGLLGELGRG
jgi:hypothetical protein